MIIGEKEAAARLSSPMNLLNRLKAQKPKSNPMSLFIKPRCATSDFVERENQEIIPVKVFNPFPVKAPVKASEEPQEPPAEFPHPHSNEPVQPGIDEIMDDSEAKVKLALAHDKAIDLLTKSVNTLANKLDDVKADKLPQVIAAASKTIESIRRERLEAIKNNAAKEVHLHFYTPQQKRVEDYEIVEVS